MKNFLFTNLIFYFILGNIFGVEASSGGGSKNFKSQTEARDANRTLFRRVFIDLTNGAFRAETSNDFSNAVSRYGGASTLLLSQPNFTWLVGRSNGNKLIWREETDVEFANIFADEIGFAKSNYTRAKAAQFSYSLSIAFSNDDTNAVLLNVSEINKNGIEPDRKTRDRSLEYKTTLKNGISNFIAWTDFKNAETGCDYLLAIFPNESDSNFAAKVNLKIAYSFMTNAENSTNSVTGYHKAERFVIKAYGLDKKYGNALALFYYAQAHSLTNSRKELLRKAIAADSSITNIIKETFYTNIRIWDDDLLPKSAALYLKAPSVKAASLILDAFSKLLSSWVTDELACEFARPLYSRAHQVADLFLKGKDFDHALQANAIAADLGDASASDRKTKITAALERSKKIAMEGENWWVEWWMTFGTLVIDAPDSSSAAAAFEYGLRNYFAEFPIVKAGISARYGKGCRMVLEVKSAQLNPQGDILRMTFQRYVQDSFGKIQAGDSYRTDVNSIDIEKDAVTGHFKIRLNLESVFSGIKFY